MTALDLYNSMTRYSLRLSLVFILFAGAARAQYEDQYVSYADFYNGLAPYGQWIQEPQYGYVWAPAVEGDFRPYYTNGKWVMTEMGNLWASEYPWGWAAFHYGRWTYDSYYGWLWIPGGSWAPAWVSWRAGDGVFGWAPLGPGAAAGHSDAKHKCPADWWVFLPQRYIYHDQYYRYWNGPVSNSRHLKHTQMMTSTFDGGEAAYYTGPALAQVKQAVGNPVQVYRVRDSKSRNIRVHNDEVKIFKPGRISASLPGSGDDPYPPDVVVAPQPLAEPGGVTDAPTGVEPFRKEMLAKRNEPRIVPGTGINPTAEPERRATRTDNNPYEWDVSRHVKQQPQPPAAPKPPAKQPAKTTPGQRGTPARPGSNKPVAPGASRPLKPGR